MGLDKFCCADYLSANPIIQILFFRFYPLNFMFQILSLRFYFINSIMQLWILLHRFYYINSIVQILLSIFYSIGSILQILLFGFIVQIKVLLCRFYYDLLCNLFTLCYTNYVANSII